MSDYSAERRVLRSSKVSLRNSDFLNNYYHYHQSLAPALKNLIMRPDCQRYDDCAISYLQSAPFRLQNFFLPTDFSMTDGKLFFSVREMHLDQGGDTERKARRKWE